MRDDLKQLITIQELDIEIRDLINKKKTMVRELETMSNKVEIDEKAMEEEKKRLTGSKVHIKEVELNIADKKNQIAKYQEQLFKVKNNKEYTALIHEVSKLEEDISLLEDKLLEFMEESDEENMALNEVRSDLEATRNKYQELKTSSESLLQRLTEEIEENKRKKLKMTAGLDPDLYETYEMIFFRKSDRAIVKVNNGACGGCNMELPAEVINDLHREEKISQCENCGRFIYI